MTTSTIAATTIADVLAGVADVSTFPVVKLPAERGPVVVVDDDGMRATADAWSYPVRLYVPASFPSLHDSQVAMRALADNIQTALRRAGWNVAEVRRFDPTLDSWVVEWIVDFQRDDLMS